MEYQLENIPVWKAYEEKAACPLCFLGKKADAQYVSFYLGNSVMAPEIRVKVNKSGFCPNHWKKLLAGRNKLGMSLMTSTHLDTLVPFLKKGMENEIKAGSKRGKPEESGITEKTEECPICDRLDHTLGNYTYTIVHLYRKEEEFQKIFANSKGFCLPHTGRIVSMAAKFMKKNEKSAFIEDLKSLYLRRIELISKALSGFQQKFDYRSGGTSMTKAEQESLKEAVIFLSGE